MLSNDLPWLLLNAALFWTESARGFIRKSVWTPALENGEVWVWYCERLGIRKDKNKTRKADLHPCELFHSFSHTFSTIVVLSNTLQKGNWQVILFVQLAQVPTESWALGRHEATSDIPVVMPLFFLYTFCTIIHPWFSYSHLLSSVGLTGNYHT